MDEEGVDWKIFREVGFLDYSFASFGKSGKLAHEGVGF